MRDSLVLYGVLLAVACGVGLAYQQKTLGLSWFLDRHLASRGTERPALWLFYPSDEMNSRNWLDFGARSSRALNVPFLNLCYQTIAHHNGSVFHLRVISGISGVVELLGEDALPPLLKRHGELASLGVAEMSWIRSAILARFGGLWLDPSVVCLKSFDVSDKVVFYGTDPRETLAGRLGTPVPGSHALWVPTAKHPMMVEWEQICYQRVAEKRGGEQIRHDYAWDVKRMMETYGSLGMEVIPYAELSRKQDGKRVQLEDLLAAGTEGALPFDVLPHTIYVPFPWEEILTRERFGWFLRMSEQQILDSDLVVRHLLDAAQRSKV